MPLAFVLTNYIYLMPKAAPKRKPTPGQIFGVDLYPFSGSRDLRNHAVCLNETRCQLEAAGIDPNAINHNHALRIGA